MSVKAFFHRVVPSVACWLSAALFCAATAFAAHTLDTFNRYPTTANSTSTGNPITFTYTCGAGSTVLVIGIAHATSTNRAGGAPTYNGLTMTQANTVQKAATSPEIGAEVWYLLAPPTGSAYTLTVPNTGAQATKINIASFKAQSGYTSALDVANGCNATSTNPTCSVTTTVNGDVIFAQVGDGATTWAGTPNRTGLYTAEDLGAYGESAQYLLQAAFAATAMSWTFGTAEDWGEVVVSFKETASSGATVSLAGQGSAASAGTLAVNVVVDATATMSGTAGTSGHGNLAVTGTISATATLSGNAGISAHGSLTMAAAADADAILSGTSAASGHGNIIVSGDAALALAGSGATAGHGNIGVSGDAALALSGAAAAAAHGNLLVSGAALAALAGSGATAAPGELSVVGAGGAAAPLSGSGTTSAAGALFVYGNAAIPLTGSSATAAPGNLGMSAATPVPLLGGAATSAHGALGVSGSGSVSLSGAVMVASAGNLGATVSGQFIPGKSKTKKIEVKGFRYLRQ